MNNFNILRYLLVIALLHICSGTPRIRDDRDDCDDIKPVDITRTSWEFPWLVSIVEITEETNFIRSGALIHPSVVVSGNDKYIGDAIYRFKVRAGKWRSGIQLDPRIFQERFIEKRIVYPRYHIWLEPVSIALYFLKTPFKITCSPNIGVAHLNVILPPADANCLSVKVTPNYTVQQLNVSIHPTSTCEDEIFSEIFLQFNLDSSALCASSNDLDLPYNDGTSVLVCETENYGTSHTLYGISALNINPLITQISGVYNSVSERFSWINEQVQGELKTDISPLIKGVCDL